MLNQIINQRYEIVEKIAESSLFIVFKGRDRVANRVVVLKSLQTAYAGDTALVEGLQAGFGAAENLSQPNIAPALEQGVDSGRPYFVTEFVRGINLKERVRRIAPFTLSVAVDFACAIGEALHFAHSIGQVHGNLRPQDIIISPEGQVKVTDFGVQKGVARSPKAQRDSLQTSAPYHAPELSTTHPGTPAGDVYALGAILYEMLTGTPPYSGDTPDAIADKHAFSEIPSPRTINPGVPRSVEGIVVKCLQKKPDDRYRTIADLLNDLKSVRDALRFGKPLSWTPIDIDSARQAPVRPATPLPQVIEAPRPARVPEPVAAVAASSEVLLPMPAENRLRRADDRISIYIKAALVCVTVIIFAALIGMVGVWSLWVVPPSTPAPELVGRSIDKVREIAKSAGAELREHGEYSEKKLNIVYRTDLEKGTTLRPKQVINVWFSKGSGYANVPNVTKLTRDEAEKKLKEAGLTVGTVTPTNSETVLPGYIVSQNVSPKKRVLHDSVVSLTVSDGPKMAYADPNQEANATTRDDSNPDTNETALANPDRVQNEHGSPDDGPKTCKRSLSIPRDGQGVRQVRVEFADARGTQTPVDEPHNEGDSIPIQFDYYGKTVTLTVYYDSEKKKEFTFDPQKSRRQRLR